MVFTHDDGGRTCKVTSSPFTRALSSAPHSHCHGDTEQQRPPQVPCKEGGSGGHRSCRSCDGEGGTGSHTPDQLTVVKKSFVGAYGDHHVRTLPHYGLQVSFLQWERHGQSSRWSHARAQLTRVTEIGSSSVPSSSSSTPTGWMSPVTSENPSTDITAQLQRNKVFYAFWNRNLGLNPVPLCGDR